MSYKEIAKNVHLITQEMDRKSLEVELIYTSGGSVFEVAKDRGKKHLLEHCIASRTEFMDFNSFKDYQFRENILINAYTGPLTMGLTASGHNQDAHKMLDIVLEMALIPTFDQKILEQEKEIVLREISERRGDPNYRLHYETANQVFTENSYETHETLGDSEMVNQTSLEDFSNLHTQNLQKSHLIINLSGGGINEPTLKEKILDYIQKSKQNHYIQTFLDEQKNAVNYKIGSQFKEFSYLPVVSDLGHSHAEVTIYISVARNFENKPAQKIFEELYLKYYGKVYDRLRNELGLIYSMQATFELELQHLSISFACEIRHIQTIVKEIEQVLGNFDKNFDESKLQEFKQILRKKSDISKDFIGTGSQYICMSLRNFGIPEEFDDYIKRLDLVTKEDIKAIYQELQTNFGNKRIVVVSKDKEIENIKV